MRFPCGHKADAFLTRSEVQQLKWCANCDPALKAKRQKQEHEARARNRRTQRDLDRIGMGEYGPEPEYTRLDLSNWNPTPEQFFNAIRAVALFGPRLGDDKESAS